MVKGGISEWFTGCYHDEGMRDGYFEVLDEPDFRLGFEYFATPATWYAIHLIPGAKKRIFAFLNANGPGLYQIPMSLLDPEAAEDVRRGMALVDAEPSEFCLYPPCILPAVTVRDGFPVCDRHNQLLQDWDDLTAVAPPIGVESESDKSG